MSAPLLALEGVVARRGDFRLGPVTLAVRPGEVVALVGPNGAGKSTLLSVATGAAREAGECRLAGDDPARLSRAEVARRAALVRQGAAPRLAVTAEELVLHGRWVHLSGLRLPGEADLAVAREALSRCGLGGFAGRDARTLSGGEMQRVMLAKALAQESPLLLLDEPTASLDLGQRVRVLRLVRDLVADGRRGCLLVSHDLDLVAELCDRVAVGSGGHVVAVGTPEEALTPDVLEAAYGVRVHVAPHPLTGHPHVAVLGRDDTEVGPSTPPEATVRRN